MKIPTTTFITLHVQNMNIGWTTDKEKYTGRAVFTRVELEDGSGKNNELSSSSSTDLSIWS